MPLIFVIFHMGRFPTNAEKQSGARKSKNAEAAFPNTAVLYRSWLERYVSGGLLGMHYWSTISVKATDL